MAENKAAVLQGNSQFAINLFKVLSENQDNLFFSPLSIHIVLSMIHQGAQGTTAQALASSLQVPDVKAAEEGYSEIINSLNSVKNVTLLMANKIFLKDGGKLQEAFASAVTTSFLSKVQLIDFTQSEAAASTINTWVEEQTQGKIKELFSSEDLSGTRLVLVNAIYFKGNWKHKFHKKATKTERFYLNKVDTMNVQMMHIRCDFMFNGYDDNLDAQILELPYINEDLNLLIILPKKKNGIKDLENKLADVDLSYLTKDLDRRTVQVALPKFKIEQTMDLEEPLAKLGLGEIFAAKANFQGMLEGGEDLCVDKVVQKAFIEVNEEGSEAAVATGTNLIYYSSKGHRAPDPQFIADHPFIFHLTQERTTSLFVGRIMNPSSPTTELNSKKCHLL